MQQNDQHDVIIYRVREQGLEVFLVNPTSEHPGAENTAMPVADVSEYLMAATNSIELESVTNQHGEARKAIAIEADWHEIPSLRALMYEDYRVAKEKAKQHLKNLVPDLDKGAYIAVKDAFKRVMPEQYAFLKELKDIVLDKNQTKYV
jgi:predicted NUDIX family NTP pyrophosphohydrolase